MRVEFWNGHLASRTGRHVTTKHNPCLWTNVGEEDKPWRSSYPEALTAVDQWRWVATDEGSSGVQALGRRHDGLG